MTRILMRAQMQHDMPFSPDNVLLENLMGGNNGNWLYQYSLFRTLMVDSSVKIDTFNANKQNINKEFIRHVNENYDYFVIPLANAFKTSFARELRSLTKMIKDLNIPCIVIGIGIQAKLGKDFCTAYEDKDAAKDFVKAVLDKSSMIGVRGEATGNFLKYLGFKEEVDFTVIGCPSMYLYGSKLPEVKPFIYSDEATFLYHSKVEHETAKVLKLMNNIITEHPNYLYSPQRLGDMIKSYFGTDYRVSNKNSKERFFDNAKTVCFTSPYRWTDYLSKNVDLAFGTRFHGSVAAILSGVPAFIVATDQRVSELADYHNIAHITINETDENTTIKELTQNIDFNRIHICHEERFNHFVDFLEKNELKSIYSENRNSSEAYFDTVIRNTTFSDDVLSFEAVDDKTKIYRTQKAAEFYSVKYDEAQNRLKEQKAKIKELEKTLQSMEGRKEKSERNLDSTTSVSLFKRIFK